MDQVLMDFFKILIENWAIIFIYLLPRIYRAIKGFTDFLIELKDFIKEMKILSNENHKLLKLFDERLTTVEQLVDK